MAVTDRVDVGAWEREFEAVTARVAGCFGLVEPRPLTEDGSIEA
ncbi:hypothetical protein [Nocardia sp. R7R-8]